MADSTGAYQVRMPVFLGPTTRPFHHCYKPATALFPHFTIFLPARNIKGYFLI
jgi:hypothetical protein